MDDEIYAGGVPSTGDGSIYAGTDMPEVIELRPDVQKIAEAIEMRMRAHDHDRGNSYLDMTDTEVMIYVYQWYQQLIDAIMDTMNDGFDDSEPDVAKIRKYAASLGAAAMFAYLLADRL